MIQENSKKKKKPSNVFVEHVIYASPLLNSSFPPAQPTSVPLFFEFLLPSRRPQTCCPGERIQNLVCYQSIFVELYLGTTFFT